MSINPKAHRCKYRVNNLLTSEDLQKMNYDYNIYKIRRGQMQKKDIERINTLARKAKQEGLTEEELEEQAALRKLYIAEFKASLTSQLENTYIVDKDGNKKKVKRKES